MYTATIINKKTGEKVSASSLNNEDAMDKAEDQARILWPDLTWEEMEFKFR